MTKDGEKVRDGCKTEKSTRTLQLPPYIISLISAIPHESETDFIIPKSRREVYGHFTKLMSDNGIKMTFHDLRHRNNTKTRLSQRELLKLISPYKNPR